MTAFDRLHRAGDIRAVFTARAVAHGTAMVVHARRRPDSGSARATVIAGRTIGDAVRRNRAKRRLRAALRHATPPMGLDVVVVAQPPALTEDFPALVGDVDRLLARVTRIADARSGHAPLAPHSADSRAG